MGDEDGVVEEEEWQERALEIIEAWKDGAPVEPGMFSSISETEPEWRTRWVG